MQEAGPYAAQQLSAAELAAREAAGAALRKIFVGMYISEQIGARKLTEIAHYLQFWGTCGMEDLALVPDPARQDHNALVKLVLGREFGNANLTYIDSPMFDKKGQCRSTVSIPIARPSDVLSEHFLGHKDACGAGELQHALGSAPAADLAEWTPLQREHVVIRRALAANVHPSRLRRLGIFMDAAGFTKNESFEGFFVNDLQTNQRFLIAVVRKAEACQCGCRGFCTYWPIHDAIRSDLESAAEGVWSVTSHLQEPHPDGSMEALRAGKPMGLVLAACELRADMPGYTGPLGFRASGHALNPCCVCNVCKAGLADLSNVTLDEGPATNFTTADYRQLVAQCSVGDQWNDQYVTIQNNADVRAILNIGGGCLQYDHRKQGLLGRRLMRPVTLSSGVELLAGDRLHPCRTLRDVANFEFQPTPFLCRFWRVGRMKSARLLHHSPLMDIPGVGMESYAIDILHTWHLGGIPRFCGKCLWDVLRSDVYAHGIPLWLSAEDTMHLKLLRLRSDLWLHYQQMRAADPEWSKRASQIWNLTLKMLGKETNPCVKAKASESRHLLDFCHSLMEKHQHLMEPVRAKFMLASARAAVQVNAIIRDSPRNMSRADQQRLLDAYLRHCSMFVRGGGSLVPKHHLFIHCIQRISLLGNPRFYTCYKDESLNGVVVKIARSCHKMTFMHSVHNKFRWAGKLGLSTHMF
jgi:hypothetical protein